MAVSKRWWFISPGMAYAGNIYGKDEKAARKAICISLGTHRVPKKTKLWEG